MKPSRFPSSLCRLFLCLVALFGASQDEVAVAGEKQSRLWAQTDASILPARGQRLLNPQKYLIFRLNGAALAELLVEMPMEFTEAARRKTVIMEVPMPDGKFARFRIEESPVLAPSVAAQLPGVKTFRGQGIDDRSATARFDWSPLKGFHGYVLGRAGTVYIDPYQENDRENYLIYYKHEYGPTGHTFRCQLDENTSLIRPDYKPSPLIDFSNGADLRTYRIAIAGTGEYTAFHGGQTNALAAVVTAVNRLVGIYRREAAISFTLVSGTNTIFPDAATDPYDNSGDGGQLTINQTQIDTIIGAGNYDVGHLFVTSGGGLASTPCVCTNQKAEGLSGLDMPTGDPFVVDFVAHELGHQFSGQHSYNDSGDGGCTTRSAADAFEPASGATIMSYCGVCNPRNLQGNSLDLFSVQSLAQIINYRNDGTGGASCGTLTTPGNTPPVLGALANFTIPRNTPFSLSATATDANDPANQLTYSWEENDLGPASGTATTPDSDADGMARPIFRILPPTNAASTRNFPSLTYILNNANVPPVTYTGTSATGAVCNFGNCITGEILPSIGRAMSFRVTVRDNNAGSGGVADAAMTVTVDGATGPFRVTAPNTNVSWPANSTQTVTWDVGGSNANAANVKISFSADGGQTFPTTILAATPNDGTEQITVPNIGTTQARLKVEGLANIFFDISDVNFTVTGGGPVPTPTPSATPSATPGATPTPRPATLANISTRLQVGTADRVMIAGFIVQGSAPKRVLIRAAGPSLTQFGVPNALANPRLELHDASSTIGANDDWQTTQIGGVITADQVVDIQNSQLAPANPAESAIIATLPPGNYSAIVQGLSGGTGVGIVEVYDLNAASGSLLGNIATRGFVQTGDNAMIGGFIVVTQPTRVIIRAIGPSLTQFGVPDALANPQLELNDATTTIARNDDWQTTQIFGIITSNQVTDIQNSQLAPTNPGESAIIAILQPGSYTAIVRGANNATGNGLVEVYSLP
jgi:hypothetical protein